MLGYIILQHIILYDNILQMLLCDYILSAHNVRMNQTDIFFLARFHRLEFKYIYKVYTPFRRGRASQVRGGFVGTSSTFTPAYTPGRG